jgi:hypothetical protein
MLPCPYPLAVEMKTGTLLTFVGSSVGTTASAVRLVAGSYARMVWPENETGTGCRM